MRTAHVTHSVARRDTTGVLMIGSLCAHDKRLGVTRTQFLEKKGKQNKIKIKFLFILFVFLRVLNVEAGRCLVGLRSQFKDL